VEAAADFFVIRASAAPSREGAENILDDGGTPRGRCRADKEQQSRGKREHSARRTNTPRFEDAFLFKNALAGTAGDRFSSATRPATVGPTGAAAPSIADARSGKRIRPTSGPTLPR